MARIFWVTCPDCRGRFSCHWEELHSKGIPLLCPYCNRTFLDSESPVIQE